MYNRGHGSFNCPGITCKFFVFYRVHRCGREDNSHVSTRKTIIPTCHCDGHVTPGCVAGGTGRSAYYDRKTWSTRRARAWIKRCYSCHWRDGWGENESRKQSPAELASTIL